MNTLTIKIPETLHAQLERLAKHQHQNKSEVVRQAISSFIQAHHKQVGQEDALADIADLVGCFSGGPSDLSSNPVHLAEFGKR